MYSHLLLVFENFFLYEIPSEVDIKLNWRSDDWYKNPYSESFEIFGTTYSTPLQWIFHIIIREYSNSNNTNFRTIKKKRTFSWRCYEMYYDRTNIIKYCSLDRGAKRGKNYAYILAMQWRL